MIARLSEKEARALGLTAPKGKRKRTRGIAKGPYETICHDCEEVFVTQAAETAHLEETGHARYALRLKP